MKKEILKLLASQGYIAQEGLGVVLSSVLGDKSGRGARAILLEGLPGTGKTALAEALSRAFEAPLVFGMLHSWSSSDDLFVGINVPAAVAGKAEEVAEPGILLRAARASHGASPDRPVVVCLDEVDKAPESVENLLLDWLQSGRVPVAPGVAEQTELRNVMVVLTSNGARSLSDPLLRRVVRVNLEPLPWETVEGIVEELVPAATKALIRATRMMATEVATADGALLTLQELAKLVNALLHSAEDVAGVRHLLAAYAARGDKGRNKAMVHRLASVAWGRILEARE